MSGLDPVDALDQLGAVWSPDFDAYASGQLDISRVRCVLCGKAPCACRFCELRHVSYLGAESVCGMRVDPAAGCPRGSAADHLPAWLRNGPELLDARRGPVEHACRGTWQYVGLNRGGHEIYACDSGAHGIIGPHVAADHVCSPVCGLASVAGGAS